MPDKYKSYYDQIKDSTYCGPNTKALLPYINREKEDNIEILKEVLEYVFNRGNKGIGLYQWGKQANDVEKQTYENYYLFPGTTNYNGFWFYDIMKEALLLRSVCKFQLKYWIDNFSNKADTIASKHQLQSHYGAVAAITSCLSTASSSVKSENNEIIIQFDGNGNSLQYQINTKDKDFCALNIWLAYYIEKGNRGRHMAIWEQWFERKWDCTLTDLENFRTSANQVKTNKSKEIIDSTNLLQDLELDSKSFNEKIRFLSDELKKCDIEENKKNCLSLLVKLYFILSTISVSYIAFSIFVKQ